jgi:hypothetical protein
MLGRLGLTAQEYEAATYGEWMTPDHMLAQHDPVSLPDRRCTHVAWTAQVFL